MKEGGFSSDMLRVVKHSNRFPRETVDVPSSEMFKGNLDESLNNQVKQKVPLPMAGLIELDDLQRSLPTSTIQRF